MSEPKRLLEVAKQLRLLLIGGECLNRVEVVKLAVEFAQIAQRYLVADFPAPIEKVKNDEFRVVEFIIGRKADCSSPGDLSGWESKDEKTKVDMLEWCLLEVGILSNSEFSLSFLYSFFLFPITPVRMRITNCVYLFDWQSTPSTGRWSAEPSCSCWATPFSAKSRTKGSADAGSVNAYLIHS